MSTPEPEKPTERRPRPLRWVLSTAVTALLLFGLSRMVDLERALGAVTEADPAWLGLGLGLYFVLQAVRAARYRLLAETATARLLLSVHFVHAFLLRVMPFRTGELGFAWLMRRGGAGGVTKNLVGVLLVRVLDLSTVVLVFAAGVTLFGGPTGVPWWLTASLALVAVLATLFTRELLSLAVRVAAAVMAATGLTRVERLERALDKLQDAATWARGLSFRRLNAVTLLTLFQWSVNFVLFYVLLRAMGVRASVAQVAMGGTGSVVGGFIPVAGVGNLGTLETGWALGFASAGLEVDVAIATAFGFSVFSFGYACLTALIGWLFLPRPSSVS